MFNQSGRLVKKKKTTIQFNTKDPVFNETLNFEVSPHQLDSSRFLITLCSRRPELDMMVMEDIALQDSSDQDNSAYFFEGLVFLQSIFIEGPIKPQSYWVLYFLELIFI